MIQFSVFHPDEASALRFDQQMRLLACSKEMITIVEEV